MLDIVSPGETGEKVPFLVTGCELVTTIVYDGRVYIGIDGRNVEEK